MSNLENIDTIYNYLVVADSTVDTATQLTNQGLTFGQNLNTTPITSTITGSGINTPAGNINYVEVLAIRDATQSIHLPIPNDNTTLKIVDTVSINSQVNPIGATKTNYTYNSITSSNGLTINGLTNFTTCPQTASIPVSDNDLVNLNYYKNNPPSSAVIYYLNNSQVPVPPINTYKLLG